jgi:membrane protein DedA with SNARE-associated domain/membrane-associated phospholipid phosphatase
VSGLLDTAASLASPWAYVVLALLAAAESAAFVGLAIPGETAMLLGGFLAFQGRVSLGVMMAAGAVGAVVGDSVGYEVGHLFGEPLKHSRLGRRVGQRRWARGEAYLRAKGGRAVFLGRFVGVLRALVPALAGMSGMPYRTFLPRNLAGGVIWAPGFVLLGYLAGGSYQRVERIAGRASLLLLVLLVVGGAVVAAARWVARNPDRLRGVAGRQLDRPWVARLRARYQRQLAFLTERLRPGGALGLSLTASVAALVGAGWAFGAVLQDVLARDELELVDRPVAVFFVRHREAWLTRVLQDVTNLGSIRILLPLILVVGVGWRLRRRTWRPLGLLVAAYAGADLAFNAVKELVRRPRPPASILLKPVAGSSFPSGHATQAVAVYGMLAALLATATPRWGRKVAAWTVAVVVVGLVGLSRLYLGAHWLTDVLAGWALGAAWLFALLTLVRTLATRHHDHPHPPPEQPPVPPSTPPTPARTSSAPRATGGAQRWVTRPSPRPSTRPSSTGRHGCSRSWRRAGWSPCPCCSSSRWRSGGCGAVSRTLLRSRW